jgi:prolyl-tRNA synthetase
MRMERGVEVGNIFKLGTRFSDAMGCYYLDADGQSKPVIMGSYGIGSGRLLACVAEQHHDEHGLVWPITVAPYHVHLVLLRGKAGGGTGEDTGQIAERLYADLQAAGIEVLYDDRQESPGVKFNDADLIGLPIRLMVSERALKAGGVEFKRREQVEKEVLPLERVVLLVQEEIAALKAEVGMKVVGVRMDD